MASGVRGGGIGWPPARKHVFQGAGCCRDGEGMGGNEESTSIDPGDGQCVE
jgi:hypothetical protein